MSQETSTAKPEIEIKVRLTDRAAFAASLSALGFRLLTPETMERNTLFDTPDGLLRKRGQLVRIRHYGTRWVLTHKAPAQNSTAPGDQLQVRSTPLHKARVETETEIGDGQILAAVFQHLGYQPIFLYEKLRTEWSDGEGHVVTDVTPIGDFAEIEGEPGWIDATAANLGISPSQYLTISYGQLFLDWKKSTNSPAGNMTFAEVGSATNR